MKKSRKDCSRSETRPLVRRDFLLCAGALPAALAAAGRLRASTGERSLETIGLQLYTVRDLMAADVAKTLDQVAAIGYDGVEFAGYFGHSALATRRFLSDSGLSSPSAHITLEDMRSSPGGLIETAVTIGHEYLVLAWLGEEERVTLDQYRSHAELCNRFAQQCRSAGIRFAYHNHAFEFEPIEGVVPMDLLLAETDPGLVQMEIDFYWTKKGKADPFAYFERYPGRFPLCHVKDMAQDGSITDVGAGTIDFESIFASGDQSGLKHYYVEHDHPGDALASIARSHAAVKAMRF